MDDSSKKREKLMIKPHFYLEQAQNCFSFLNWELLIEDIFSDKFEEVILKLGFSEKNSIVDSFYIFDKKNLGRFVVVPKTGRIQLRIDILIPEEERQLIAVDLCEKIATLMKC